MPPPSRAELWNSGQDETVEVNQRALIDSGLSTRRSEKIEAELTSQRFSLGTLANTQVGIPQHGPLLRADARTVFRELLQNADDAGVSSTSPDSPQIC